MTNNLKYSQGFSLTLFLVGLFFFATIGVYEWLKADVDHAAAAIFSYLQVFVGIYGLTLVCAALSRTRGGKSAEFLTNVSTVLLLLAFPLGTFLAVYWYRTIRPREMRLPPGTS